MSRFAYKERSAETVSARSKQSGGSYDSYLNSSLSFLKVKEGQNDLRILPPTWDTDGPWGDNWGVEIYIHRDIGPDRGAYLCLDEMRKKYGTTAVPNKLGKCPICAARHEIPEDDADALKKLKAGKQILAYVINRDAEKEGPQVWRLGWKLERDIQILSQDKKSGAVLAIDHPDRGYDISFTRTGQGLKTDYSAASVARDDSPLHEKQAKQDKWLEFITDNPLTEQLVFFDADYLEAVFAGTKGGKGDDVEEDDRPTRSKRPAARDADDEVEERPRRRAAEPEDDDEPAPKAKRRAVEEDDDEPAPRRRAAVAEDDDEPAPRRRARDEVEEDEPQPRRRAVVDEEEDRPRARKRPADDEDELPDDRQMARNATKARRAAEPEEDEDEPAPRRKPSRAVEEDDDEPAPRRRAAVVDEDDDEPAPKGKASDRAKESLERLKPKKR